MIKQPTRAQARAYWESLDLSRPRARMGSDRYPLARWTPDLLDTCELLYRRFLWLLVIYPEHPCVPTRDIDEFWHNHILHTKDYVRDCQGLAGHYLHHEPADLSDPAAYVGLSEQFEKTQALYLAEFGEPLLILNRQ